MQHWDRDPNTGDYIIEKGSPKQTESLTIPAFIRVKTPRNSWLYAPDNDWGSDFASVTKNRSTVDPGLYESLGAAALAPLIEDGRADQVSVEVSERARHGVAMNILIEQANGEVEQLVLKPVGA